MKPTLWLATLAVMLGALPLAASDDPGRDTTPAADPTFILGNVEVLKFRVGASGLTPQERWVMVNKRITKIMNRDIDPEDVNVRGSAIYIGQSHLVTATSADARANGASAAQLARTWAANLRRAIRQADQT